MLGPRTFDVRASTCGFSFLPDGDAYACGKWLCIKDIVPRSKAPEAVLGISNCAGYLTKRFCAGRVRCTYQGYPLEEEDMHTLPKADRSCRAADSSLAVALTGSCRAQGSNLVRIRGRFCQTATATGRLSMEDPNLQTAPKTRQFNVAETQAQISDGGTARRGRRSHEANIRCSQRPLLTPHGPVSARTPGPETAFRLLPVPALLLVAASSARVAAWTEATAWGGICSELRTAAQTEPVALCREVLDSGAAHAAVSGSTAD